MKNTDNGKLLKKALISLSLFLLGCAASFAVFAFTALQNPGTASHPHSDLSLGLMESFHSYAGKTINNTLGGVSSESVSFTIPETTVVCAQPSPDAYGVAESDSEISDTVRSSLLIDESELVWKAGTKYYNNDVPEYYSDPSILVIRWKEFQGDFVLHFAEVVIADGSQFRRYLCDNTYGSTNKRFGSEMSKSVNAVIGMGGDYYVYRRVGVVVYQGVLYRNNPKDVDYCLVDDSGDMIFKRGYELGSNEELEKYVRENNIRFSMSFGPILVEDHKTDSLYYSKYPLGEPVNYEARAAIGMIAPRHYLLCILEMGHEDGLGGMVKDMARIFVEKGCEKAYELDGGQTAEIFFNNRLHKAILINSERITSDIIYFATSAGE